MAMKTNIDDLSRFHSNHHKHAHLRMDNNDQHVQDTLAFDVALISGKHKYTVPAANVKQCSLELHSYGFSGTLGFWLPNSQQQDALITAFVSDSLIGLHLNISPVMHLPDPAPSPLSLVGLVKRKQVEEKISGDVSGRPVCFRYYEIAFNDAAQFLWTQHFPTQIYVDKTLRSIIEAQLSSQISMRFESPELELVKPLQCLALGNRDCFTPLSTGSSNRASFYDFVIVFLLQHNAHLIYDYSDNSYLIADEKPKIDFNRGFLPYEILHLKSMWADIPRYSSRLLNGICANPESILLPNDNAVTNIEMQYLLRESLQADVNAYKTLAREKHTDFGEQLDVVFSRWPLQDISPSGGFFVDDKIWGNNTLYGDKKYRIFSLFIEVSAVDCRAEKDLGDSETQYHFQYRALCELFDCRKPHLPCCIEPNYPLFVEALVESVIGTEDDKTYDIVTNESSGQFQYRVHIPLWQISIFVGFEADHMNNHFFFPLYRGATVLLKVDCYQAAIHKVLDWGKGVQLSLDTQGNHILMGKHSRDETSFKHVYEEDKPVFSIKRVKENDTELLRLEEGSIILQTCEESK